MLNGKTLVLLAAAMYGTNFPCVKLLDQMIPSPISAALRFSLAALAVGAAVVLSEKCTITTIENDEKERRSSMWRGMEVGAWYMAGYIAQSLALQNGEAGKVRKLAIAGPR